jgi:hypothetical protein
MCKKFCESKVIIKRFLVARKLFLWKKVPFTFCSVYLVFLEMSGWRLSTAIVLATTVIRR